MEITPRNFIPPWPKSQAALSSGDRGLIVLGEDADGAMVHAFVTVIGRRIGGRLHCRVDGPSRDGERVTLDRQQVRPLSAAEARALESGDDPRVNVIVGHAFDFEAGRYVARAYGVVRRGSIEFVPASRSGSR